LSSVQAVSAARINTEFEKGFFEFFSEIDPVAWTDCERIMASSKSLMIEEKFGDIWYLSFKHPLNINGVCHGILVVSMDVTEKKGVEIPKREAKIAEWKNNEGN
jgi:hypothetical protein